MKLLALHTNVKAFSARYRELDGWRLLFLETMPKRQLGVTIFPAQSIHYNANILSANHLEVCIKILLHEVAHAITDYRYGKRDHGLEFRMVCTELGIGSEAFLNVRYPKQGPAYHCHNCGREDWSYSRRSRSRVNCLCGERMFYHKNN